jgi:glycerate kinase
MGTAPLEPLRATSYGLGEAILALVARGCREVVVGLGGSATTDGGAGMLQALGAQLTTAAREPIPRGAAGLAQLCHADLAPARARLAGVHLIAACDVTNPLFGEDGAARVYGPQKGATPNEVDQLDHWLAHLAGVVEHSSTPPIARSPGAGAAGGAGYALLALGAEFRAGTELILDLLQFQQRLNHVNLVITGEGSLDAQSLNGKAPIGVAQKAAKARIPVVAAAGRVTLTQEQLTNTGIVEVHSLIQLEPDIRRSHETAPALLQEIGRRIAASRLSSC